MDVKFDFENVGECLFGKILRPIAKVSFQSLLATTWITTWMVVDTGADFSILPRYLIDDLGISIEKDCVIDITLGIGGQQTLYLLKSKVRAKIGLIERDIPLAIIDSNNIPPLLGRLGFMETFDTLFSKKHQVIFKE